MSGGSRRSWLTKRSKRRVVLGWVDRRDAEHEADGRVSSRAAALAEDAARPGEAHDGMDGEEVRSVAELLDQVKLMAAGGRDHVGDAVRVALGRTLPGQPLQLLLGGLARLRLGRVLVAQLIE